MPFNANTFTFDGVPSEFYNLYLGGVDVDGVSTAAGSNDVSLLTQKLFRRPSPLYYGAEQSLVLTFPLSMYSPDEILSDSFSEISTWLFGQQNYKKLRICQTDMQSTYFNAFLTAPKITRVGNIIQAIDCIVLADAPWGWGEDVTNTYSYNAQAYTITDSIEFLNTSANSFYTYPTSLIITSNIFGGSVTITNTDDENREFVLTLLPNEVITMNCDLQIISSTLAAYPLTAFNYNWLRFVQGLNRLAVNGNISALSITYTPAVKVAG
jgi:hypothetical protein